MTIFTKFSILLIVWFLTLKYVNLEYLEVFINIDMYTFYLSSSLIPSSKLENLIHIPHKAFIKHLLTHLSK